MCKDLKNLPKNEQTGRDFCWFIYNIYPNISNLYVLHAVLQPLVGFKLYSRWEVINAASIILKAFIGSFSGVIWGPTKNLGRIGSTVLKFIGYKRTNRSRLIDKDSVSKI